MAKADWVVAGGRIGEQAHCTRCGEGLEISIPQRLDTMLGAWNGFIKAHSRCKPGSYQEPAPKSPADWIWSRDTGVSSATLWAAATGVPSPYREYDVPHDPSDFGRCYRLLKLFPQFRDALPKTVTLCPKWEPFVEHWGELTALFEEESPSRVAPKLWARMQELEKRKVNG